jgi:hypothetical protein
LGRKTSSDSEKFAFSGSPLLTAEPLATPLSSTLALYATGLGVIALLALRKRRRTARPA